MGLVLAPKTGEPTAAPPNLIARALHEPIESSSAMIWEHLCPTHEERAKLLEGRAAAAHFGCCVFMCLCVLVVVLWARLATFSHLTCKKVKMDWGFGLNFAHF